ncbi:ABC transporter permease [Candidatus Pacearchaeota archaeon]|nr:ABC transporter permease [Candidatus Pacearchaeota archaeon]
MIGDYFSMAVKNVRKRRLRSWLTMLGIFISIATIFTLLSASLGLQGAVKEQFRILGTDKFFIQPKGQAAGPGSGGAVSLTTKDVDTIEKVPGVKTLSYSVYGSAEVIFQNQKRYFMVTGYPLDKADVFTELGAYKADEGRLLKQGDKGSVMIGSQYKYNALFKKPVSAGDTLTIQGKEFKVKGILQPIGNPGDDRNILMPIDDFNQIFNITDRVDAIFVQVEQGQDLKEVVARVERRLRSERGVTEKTQDFEISTPEELLASFGTVLNIITGFLLGISAISLLVGGIGIANTMYTSVIERTREIGTMKAIGAKNQDILFIFLIESGMLGLIGGIIGVVLGIGISKSLEYIAVHQLGTTLLKSATPAYLIIGCLLFAFLSGALSGLWPAWRATKIKPVDALRYE